MQRYKLQRDLTGRADMVADDNGEYVLACNVPASHFNDLTPAQDEVLAVVVEECAELIQAVTKIQRHGLASYHPETLETNVTALAREMGDVLAAFYLVYNHHLVHQDAARHFRDRKLEKLPKFLHHAKL